MKAIVVSCLLLIVGAASAQLADQLPDTLTKKKITGSYVIAKMDYHTEFTIKGNHVYQWKDIGRSKSGKTQSAFWEIKNDTLFIKEQKEYKEYKYRMVMHNGKLYIVFDDNFVSTQAAMTKSDYKFYQRQCRQSGH